MEIAHPYLTLPADVEGKWQLDGCQINVGTTIDTLEDLYLVL